MDGQSPRQRYGSGGKTRDHYMPKDIYIGNTDHDWFRFCKENSPLREVNFWQPSRQHFKAMHEGGIFFFRCKAPINKIGGFGTLASAGVASVATCWDELGISNGTRSKEEFLERVSKYNKNVKVDEQTLVGFKILVDPVFLDEEHWIDLPADWSQNIVTGKSYNSISMEGERLLTFYRSHQSSAFRDSKFDDFGFSDHPVPACTMGQPQKVRSGQARFKFALLDAYEARCAVTGSSVEAFLEAAHIIPFSESMDNSVNNGILLRCDIHTLFDRGLLNINGNYLVELSDKFFELYPDDIIYRGLHGQKISLPKKASWHPSLNNLAKRIASGG